MDNPGRRIGLNPVPDVHTYNTSTLVSQLCQQTPDEYNQFNLQNIKAPTPPKWKDNENILEVFKKFKRSCMHIFDRPMAHITNRKVKTNMFLIWVAPDGEDVYEYLQKSPSQQYNLDAVPDSTEELG